MCPPSQDKVLLSSEDLYHESPADPSKKKSKAIEKEEESVEDAEDSVPAQAALWWHRLLAC